MRKFSSALVALLAMLLVSVAPAAAITNGIPDTEGIYPYVGMVANDDVLCTGTLLTPTLVLTAGHCTDGQTELFVTFDPVPTADTVFVSGTPVTHPEYCLGCAPGLPGYATYDVGVVVLNTPVDNVGYGALPYVGQVNNLWRNATLTAVGYGFQGYDQGQALEIEQRFYAPVSFGNNNHRLADMFLKHSTSPGQGQGGTCFGDSGGPIFAEDQVTVLAITSFGGGNCNANAYAQRIDLENVIAWIKSIGGLG